MKRGFLLLFILFVHQYVQAQNSLSGTITDSKDKSPLPGAIVSITDLKTGTTTDTTGHFEIKNIPKGNFLIEVKYIGYAAISRQVSVAGITVSDF